MNTMSANTAIRLLLLLFLASACEKKLSTNDAGFDVHVEKNALQLGEKAFFSFSKNPDIITFYSGEVGNRYNFRERVTADGTPLLSFKTIRANGTQPNSLLLLVSSDFAGVVKGDTATTKANIAKAGWTDITARAQLSTGGASTVASGDIDLSDFAAAGKPVYIAFKYQGDPGSIQNKWTISSFSIKNILPDSTKYEIANMNTSTTPYANYGVTTFSPGFAAYTIQNKYNWSVSAASLAITGATSTGSADAPAEAWVFLGAVNLKKVTPDVGIVVKNSTQNLSGLLFPYEYKTKGIFEAAFVGGRVDVEETSLSVKKINITVQ